MKPVHIASTFLVAFSALLQPAVRAQTPHALTPDEGRALAFRRAATLTDGVSASGWFGGWGDYSEEHTSTWMTPADFKMMHEMGIRYVRFPLDPALMTHAYFTPGGMDALWKRIDAAIDEAMNAGLAVDLCVFPRDDYKQQLASEHGVDEFIFLWQALAKHFANRDPDRFFFELMNESEMQDSFRWIGVQSAVVAAIRQIDTQHTIIANGAHWGSLGDLITTEPISDTDVIYNFHFYEPYQFTHQGATWGSPEWLSYKNIPFPATPDQIAAILKTIPGDNARYQLFLYGQNGWDKASIKERLGFAATWGREHHVPIICNEFGAYRDTAPPDSRARYIEAVRSGLEANGIGWGMWDWRGNFGLVTHEGDRIVPDPVVVQALGLKMP
ncbi:MAG TPA: cellulase family glycosylhydrolase [Acidobacteriaceae bacterium]|jgi:aryl-phospho-beta-D-glucosidase BglC (GH1 family)|nr:cellulase family glycosylhydrolase [Acidobacteriaceae bacterium]